MDNYAGLAVNYDCVLPDESLTSSAVGLTSPGSRDIIQRALDSLRPGAPVLDCACGIGLDAIALARSGFRVTASDGSKSMVREAEERFRKAGLKITAKHAEWADLPLMVGGPFDLVLCIGNSIAHAGGEYAMTEALRRMRSALRPNGMFIVDSRNWEALHRTRPRIITGPRMRHKDGKKCTWIYIWSIPDEFPSIFRVEVVILFEQEDGELTHESFALEFEPFSFGDLNHRLASAGFRILETTYHRDAPFYAVLAQGGRR